MRSTLLIFACLVILAAAIPSTSLNAAPPIPDDPGAPIDGGASLLVVAATLYSMKKLREKART